MPQISGLQINNSGGIDGNFAVRLAEVRVRGMRWMRAAWGDGEGEDGNVIHSDYGDGGQSAFSACMSGCSIIGFWALWMLLLIAAGILFSTACNRTYLKSISSNLNELS